MYTACHSKMYTCGLSSSANVDLHFQNEANPHENAKARTKGGDDLRKYQYLDWKSLSPSGMQYIQSGQLCTTLPIQPKMGHYLTQAHICCVPCFYHVYAALCNITWLLYALVHFPVEERVSLSSVLRALLPRRFYLLSFRSAGC